MTAPQAHEAGEGRLTGAEIAARIEHLRLTDPDAYLHFLALGDFDRPATELEIYTQAIRRVAADCVQRGYMAIAGYRDGEPLFYKTDAGRAVAKDESARPPEPLGCGPWRLSTSGPLVFTPQWIIA